ncbi:response regulator transcription factor [Dactylosporangium fulvum]|uniref:helix-turn-helix transcriptional regulator n=1 Tax=Dactylosporangium fulvum TaxID=53359 RepID=UPI0029D40F84|nr:LuxR C-terminal-related transcriptional regulator [Dactylosporangium fulvum]
MDDCWSDPRYVLDVVERLLSVPRADLYGLFSAELGKLIPHRATAIQTGDCARSPLAVAGDQAIAERVTSAEVLRLADRSEPGTAVLIDGVLGGAERRLVLLASAATVGNGSLLIVVPEETEPPTAALELAARLWRVLSADQGRRATDQEPDVLAGNLAAAAARAETLADLGQTYATTLTTLLAVLRSGRVTDDVARRTGIDIAAEALINLRAVADRDQALSSEPAAASFAMLENQIAALARHAEAGIELVGPDSDTAIPQDIAHTARTVTRGLVLAAVDRPKTTRIRASWRLDGPVLYITVRDDCPDPAGAVLAHSLAQRLTALGGHWEIDAAPGWGTTTTATLPLEVDAPEAIRPLDRLNPRELEVLSGIARGLRNRTIAERLQLSEHTVKFHVRNILDKLEVSSRGEAAALASSGGTRSRQLRTG